MKYLIFYIFNTGNTLEDEPSNSHMLEVNSIVEIEHIEETETITSQYEENPIMDISIN